MGGKVAKPPGDASKAATEAQKEQPPPVKRGGGPPAKRGDSTKAAKGLAEARSEQRAPEKRPGDLEKESLQVDPGSGRPSGDKVCSETLAKESEAPSGGREVTKQVVPAQSQRAAEVKLQPISQGSRASPAKSKGTGENPSKAAASYSGSTWVDNSEFRGHEDSSSGRAAPHRQGGTMRSGIVSLPQIHQRLPANQQELIRDLHEKIEGSLEEHPHRGPFSARKDGARRGSGHERGASPRRKLDILGDFEDMDFDFPCGHGAGRSNAASAKQDVMFNDQFASCKSAAEPAAPPRGRNVIGPRNLGPVGTRIGAQAPLPSTRAL